MRTVTITIARFRIDNRVTEGSGDVNTWYHSAGELLMASKYTSVNDVDINS
jgi:hypothetical protein